MPDIVACNPVAQAALRQIGYSTSTASPYWYHALMAAGIAALPVSAMNWWVYRHHWDIRTRAYKKGLHLRRAAAAKSE